MTANIYYHSKGEKYRNSENIPNNDKLKPSKTSSKFYSSMSSVKRLRWLYPSALLCKTHFSPLDKLYLLVQTFLGNIQWLCNFNILGSLLKPRLHFHRFEQWFVEPCVPSESSCRHFYTTYCLDSEDFWNYRERFRDILTFHLSWL